MRNLTLGAVVTGVCASALALTVNPSASAAPWCAAESLALSTGPYGSPGDYSQVHFDVILTNVSPASCTLQGYPGVDLVGPDDPVFGPTYSVPRQNDKPKALTLGSGASAASRLTFLPTSEGWVPATIVVTPPDAMTPLEVPWIPGGIAVVRQDAATNPGTYVGPLRPMA